MEKIEAFRTKGGQVFTDENKAREAQALEDLRHFWSQYGYAGMDSADAAEVCKEQASELLQLLLTVTLPNGDKDEVIRSLAKRLGFETVAVRNRDALDFKDVGIAALCEALDAAYKAGQLAEMNRTS